MAGLDHQDEQMILLLASGTMPEEDVARAYGLTPAGLREKLRKSDFHLRVEGERSRMAGMFTLAQIKFMNTLDDAVNNIVNDVKDPFSKTRMDSSWKVVNKVIPDRASLQTSRHIHEFQGSVAENLTASLDKLTAVMVPIDITKNPHVMDGHDAVPRYGEAIPASVPEPAPATQKSVGAPDDSPDA